MYTMQLTIPFVFTFDVCVSHVQFFLHNISYIPIHTYISVRAGVCSRHILDTYSPRVQGIFFLSKFLSTKRTRVGRPKMKKGTVDEERKVYMTSVIRGQFSQIN